LQVQPEWEVTDFKNTYSGVFGAAPISIGEHRFYCAPVQLPAGSLAPGLCVARVEFESTAKSTSFQLQLESRPQRQSPLRTKAPQRKVVVEPRPAR
jgi:hypothetical protein